MEAVTVCKHLIQDDTNKDINLNLRFLMTSFDKERLIHSIKTTVACIIGIIIAKIVNLPGSQWIVITVIVVMCAQLYVGSVMQKAYFRFFGTFVGCLFAAAVLLIFGYDTFAAILAISISSFVFSYVATSQENMVYTGTLGAVTTAIIMLSPEPTLLYAIERFTEISIGILIAALVSQFILPIHARNHLRKEQATTLKHLHDYYVALIVSRHSEKSTDDYHDFDEKISKSMIKQRQLAKESTRELLGIRFNPVLFMQTLYYEKMILRAITIMSMALKQAIVMESSYTILPAAHHFNEAILQSFNQLINKLENKKTNAISVRDPDFNNLKMELLKNIDQLANDELMPVEGFLFSAKLLTENLIQLGNLYSVSIWDGSVVVNK